MTGGNQGINVFYLDGHNNPGFSGGPTVFTESDKNQYKVAAVVHGYSSTEEPIFQAGKETPMRWISNTGIVIDYDIRYAVEAIKANPIGLLLT